MKLISWNVNGLRAVLTKGFKEFYNNIDTDILCIQETKMQKEQITEEINEIFKDRYVYWNSAVKKGYSGTAVFTNEIRTAAIPKCRRQFCRQGSLFKGSRQRAGRLCFGGNSTASPAGRKALFPSGRAGGRVAGPAGGQGACFRLPRWGNCPGFCGGGTIKTRVLLP